MKTHNRFGVRCVGILLVALSSGGCEPVPQERTYSLPKDQVLVSDSASSNRFRWPVVNGDWQVAKPTDVTFLRKMKQGELDQIAAEIAEQKAKQIRAVEIGTQPPPWSIESTSLTGEAKTRAQIAIGEIDGGPKLRETVAIPTDVSDPQVFLDHTARHLLLTGKKGEERGLWMVRMPWRPWWALPESPRNELDEPGDSSDFKQVAMLLSADDPISVGFAGLGDEGPVSNCLIANGKRLHLIDCFRSSVVKSLDFWQPLVHISVAAETGHVAVVDESGSLFVVDPELTRESKIAELDLSLPMPVIAPDASRVVAWKEANVGQIFGLSGGALIDDFVVPLKDVGKPMLVRSTRDRDLWIQKNRVHVRINESTYQISDKQSTPIEVYWDLVDVISLQNQSDEFAQFCIADRPTEDGTVQRVMYDAVLGNRGFLRPFPLAPYENQDVAIAGNGNVIAFYNAESIDIYHRLFKASQATSYLYRLAHEWSWKNQFEYLDILGDVILQIPDRRYLKTSDQLYHVLAEGVADEYYNVEGSLVVKRLAEERLKTIQERYDGYLEWSKKATTLHLTESIYRESRKASIARGGGWAVDALTGYPSRSPSQNLGHIAWEKLRAKGTVPAYGYSAYISLATQMGLEFEQAEPHLKEYVHRYPHEPMMHVKSALWRLQATERAGGGNPASASAYAAGVANVVGSPIGDYIYYRCIESLYKWRDETYFRDGDVDSDRMRAGIEYGMKEGMYYAGDIVTAIEMLVASYKQMGPSRSNSPYAIRARRTCESLAKYYRANFPTRLNGEVARTVGPYLP